MLSVNDLSRIAAAGGGFSLNAKSVTTNDIARIAAAASKTGARITITSAGSMPVNDLARIAAAGKGVVVFEW